MKNFKIILISVLAVLTLASCNELEQMGIFDLDETYLPDARIDGPESPATFIASYDEYCDKIVLSWVPTARASGYDLYKSGAILAADLTDTSYVDMEAISVDTEYWVVAKNAKGESEDSTFAIGRMSAVPPTPTNFSATDGEYESKVDVSWDAVDYAKYYILKRGDVVLNDSVVGTGYSDSDGAPEDETEYSLIAVSLCGESDEVTDMGYADPLVAFSKPFDVNFEGAAEGSNMEDLGFLGAYGWLDEHTGEALVEVYVDGGNGNGGIKYGHFRQTGTNAGLGLIITGVTLLEGQRYELSFDIKTEIPVTLHMRETADQQYLQYLIPSNENGNIKNDRKGTGIVGVGTAGEWTTYTQDFPYVTSQEPIDQVDDFRGKDGNNHVDTGRDNQALWSPSTITAAQTTPHIEIFLWNAAAVQTGISIDNVKILLLK